MVQATFEKLMHFIKYWGSLYLNEVVGSALKLLKADHWAHIGMFPILCTACLEFHSSTKYNYRFCMCAFCSTLIPGYLTLTYPCRHDMAPHENTSLIPPSGCHLPFPKMSHSFALKPRIWLFVALFNITWWPVVTLSYIWQRAAICRRRWQLLGM